MGTWRLNVTKSQVHGLPSAPDLYLRVAERPGKTLAITGSAEEGGNGGTSWNYPLDGSETRRQAGSTIFNTTTKWEGNVLLVSTLVSGRENYSVSERWRRSRDGNVLTIRRVINRGGTETESTLVYENTAAAPATIVAETPAPDPAPAAPASAPAAGGAWRSVAPAPGRNTIREGSSEPGPVSREYVVESGTRILLRLTNALNTKHTQVGDRVYLETSVPVFISGRLVIPRGSYVTGTVTEAKEAGRVKGRSALNLHFDTLTLPNGVARDFNSRPDNVEARGNVDRKEGRIEGDGHKAGDAGTVAKTSAAGASIGSLAGAASGHLGMGVGIGAAAGAVGGLAGVLGSRGPQVVLPAGTSIEMVLDRDLHYTAAELGGRYQ